MYPDEPRPEIMVDELRAQARRAMDARAELADIVGEATSDDGLITAVVGPRGLQGLTFDPRVMRTPSADLADAVVMVAQRASEDFIARRAEKVAEVGAAERPSLDESLQQLDRLDDMIRSGRGDARTIFERFRDQANGTR